MSEITYYTTTLTCLNECPIKEGYKVENIKSYVTTYPQAKKDFYGSQRMGIDLTTEIIEYPINIELKYLFNLDKTNYAMLQLYDKDGNLVKDLFCFVIDKKSIDSLGRWLLVLKVDYLNTYFDVLMDQLQFSPLTYIIRQHQDRFDAANMYQVDNETYLLKKIYQDTNESPNLELVNYGNLYPTTGDIRLGNYWLKIVIQDIDGTSALYMHYAVPLHVYSELTQTQMILNTFIYMQDTFVRIGDTNYSILRHLQSLPYLLDLKLVPYSPFKEFTNVNGSTSYTINDDLCTPYVFTILINGVMINLNVLKVSNAQYLRGRTDLNILPLPIYSPVYNSQEDEIQNILFNTLVYHDSTVRLERLKDEVFLNGFFSNENYSLTSEGFYNVNEPNVLSSGLLDLYIDFFGVNYNIMLEKLKYNGNINALVTNYKNGDLSQNPLLSIGVSSTLGLSPNIILKLDDSQYFEYHTMSDNASAFLNGDITRMNDSYFDYSNRKMIEDYKRYQRNIEIEKNRSRAEQEDIRRIYENFQKDENNSSFMKSAADVLSSGYSMLKSGFFKATSFFTNPFTQRKVKEYAATTARVAASALSGNILRAVPMALHALFKKEADNYQNVGREGIEEILITDREYKAKFVIKQSLNISSYELDYYLKGTFVNTYKIPTTKTRKYFDYLECIAVFQKDKVNNKILGSIQEAFLNGVTFIHNNSSVWHFPEEGLENVERSLLAAL